MDRRLQRKARLPWTKGGQALCVARLVGQIQDIVEESGNPRGFDATAWMLRWLSEPLPALCGTRPIDLLDTVEGQTLVSNTLAQIRGGAYA